MTAKEEYLKKQQERAEKIMARHKEDFPEIIFGSDKQIAYANSIRADIIDDLSYYIEQNPEDELPKAVFKEIAQLRSAVVWINSLKKKDATQVIEWAVSNVSTLREYRDH